MRITLLLSLIAWLALSPSLKAAGTLDLSFNAGAVGESLLLGGDCSPILDVVLNEDGSYYIGGHFSSLNGNTQYSGFARLNKDGSVDSNFLPPTGNIRPETSFEPLVNDIHKIFKFGTDRLVAGFNAFSQYTSEGILMNDIPDICSVIAIDSKQRIWSSDPQINNQGCGSSVFGDPLLRYNPDLTLDSDLGSPLHSYGPAWVLPDDSLLVSGSSLGIQATPSKKLIKINASGQRNEAFGEVGFEYNITDLTVDPLGRIYVAGVNKINGASCPSVVRLHPNGSIDDTFLLSSAIQRCEKVAIQPDFKILVGGEWGINRLNSDGSIDPTFQGGIEISSGFCGDESNPWGVLSVNKILVDPDGNIMIIGNFKKVNGIPRQGIARIHGDSDPFLSIIKGYSSIEIHWGRGILQTSTKLSGEWSDHSDQVSPIKIPALQKAQFFKLR